MSDNSACLIRKLLAATGPAMAEHMAAMRANPAAMLATVPVTFLFLFGQ
jgi:hypothetical protein